MILIVQCKHQKRLAQHRVRLAQVNQQKDTDHESDCAVEPPEKIAAASSSSTNNKPTFKKNFTYDVSCKKKHSWMNYNSTLKGMVCTVCEVYGEVSVQAKA